MNTAVQNRSTTPTTEAKQDSIHLPKAEYLIKFHEASAWEYKEHEDKLRKPWAASHFDICPDWPAQTFTLPFDDNNELVVQFSPDYLWTRNQSDLDYNVNSKTDFSQLPGRTSSYDSDYRVYLSPKGKEVPEVQELIVGNAEARDLYWKLHARITDEYPITLQKPLS